MRTDVRLAPATLDDAELLARTLRPEDAAEVRALGEEPLEQLRRAVEDSELALAARRAGELGCLFGVKTERLGSLATGTEITTLWSLTSHVFARHPVAFARAARWVVPALLERWPELLNAVDARYGAAQRFIHFLGGELAPAVPLGPAGQLFHPFRFRRAPWAG